MFASPGNYYFEKCVCVRPFRPGGRKGYFGVPGSPVAVRLNSTEDRAYVLSRLDRHENQELITYGYPGGKPLRKLRGVKGINGLAVSPANAF